MKKHIETSLVAAPLSIDLAALAATAGGMPSSSSSGRTHYGKQPNEIQQGTFDHVYARDRDRIDVRSDYRSVDTAAGSHQNIRDNSKESFERNGHWETKRNYDHYSRT